MSALPDATAVPAPAAPTRARSDIKDWREVVAAPGFRNAVLLALALGVLFWPLVRQLPGIWFADESYYSHGPLVPFLAAYILLSRYDSVAAKVKPGGSWLGVLMILPVLYVTYVATRTEMNVVMSGMLVLGVGVLTWAYIGFAAAWAAAPAILYLLFGLPVWLLVIDRFTQPMQEVSAETAYKILQGLGYTLLRADGDTTVYLNNFQMNVAAECSGLRLALALIAFNVLFMLTARLRWWANLFLALFTIPFAIIMNSIRVALIGVIGNEFGSEAGLKFHDFSGYVMLALCFFILMKAFQALEVPAR
jgi:exosortase